MIYTSYARFAIIVALVSASVATPVAQDQTALSGEANTTGVVSKMTKYPCQDLAQADHMTHMTPCLKGKLWSRNPRQTAGEGDVSSQR
ncbi:hypothetical protein BASA62_009702 [Batrachochytrium salamandrivorans]|nr:hypothetical protein BASA62_009702 [Batrachochytrium salamandrivorans]